MERLSETPEDSRDETFQELKELVETKDCVDHRYASKGIESVFGVHKNVSSRGPKPMGRLVLSMANRVAEEP